MAGERYGEETNMGLTIYMACDRCDRQPENDMVFFADGGDHWRQYALCDQHLPRTPRVLIWRHQWRIGRTLATFLGLGVGQGGCLKCRTPWYCIRDHPTPYNDGASGCFPLCDKCWGDLTPGRRLPYYKQLFAIWNEPEDSPKRRDITAAVLAGM